MGQEMIAIKSLFLTVPRKRSTGARHTIVRSHATPWEAHREAPGGSRGRESRRDLGSCLYCGFCGKSEVRHHQHTWGCLSCLFLAPGHLGRVGIGPE